MQGQRYYLLILSMTLVLGCKGLEKKSNANSEVDSETFTAESAVSVVNSVLNDAEQSNAYADSAQTRLNLIPNAYAASCGLSRFTPSVGSADCGGTTGDKTVNSIFASCTAGSSDEYVLQGTVILTFNSPATCASWIQGLALPTSGSVTRTTSGFTRINPNGSRVNTDSASHLNYLGQTISGGVTTAFGVGSRSVSVNGLHRVRTSNSGYRVYDHSVTSVTPLIVTGTRITGNREITSGTVRVDHNLARYSTTANFTGLRWDTSCCHPTSGSIIFNLTGTKSGSLELDFGSGSCGEVFISKNGASPERLSVGNCE